MCLIFFSINNHPRYKLIVASNRDEFYNRKTAAAHYWEDHPHVLAGRDLEAGGTWMGLTRNGKFSFITNYRDPAAINPSAPSRGHLVSEYLQNNVSPLDYMRHVEKVSLQYNGFNLVVGDSNALWYYSNYGREIKKITKGFYGLSNHLLDTPWPKIEKGKEKLAPLMKQDVINVDDLFDSLYDHELAEDHLLPDTGIGIERERALSSMFIKTPGYGSRCSTVVLIGHDNHVYFVERVYEPDTFAYTTNAFEFDL